MKYTTILLAFAAAAMALPTPRGGGQRGAAPAAQGSSSSAAPAAPPASSAPPAAPQSSSPPAAGTGATGTIDASLVPDFGITPGVPSPNQPGSCVGANGKNIPCNCPPSKSDFLAKLNLFQSQGNAQGTPFKFPTDVSDQSTATKLTRINLCIIGLQNFDNTAPGHGCPAVSAPNFTAEQASLH